MILNSASIFCWIFKFRIFLRFMLVASCRYFSKFIGCLLTILLIIRGLVKPYRGGQTLKKSIFYSFFTNTEKEKMTGKGNGKWLRFYSWFWLEQRMEYFPRQGFLLCWQRLDLFPGLQDEPIRRIRYYYMKRWWFSEPLWAVFSVCFPDIVHRQPGFWHTFRISWSSGGCWAGLFSWFSDFLREPLSGVLRWRLRRCWTVFPYLQEGFLSDMVWAGRF